MQLSDRVRQQQVGFSRRWPLPSKLWPTLPAPLVVACARRVRHEAGEALGAIGTEECLVPLREHLNDEVLEVGRWLSGKVSPAYCVAQAGVGRELREAVGWTQDAAARFRHAP